MSDGINPSELSETPRRTDEVKETAEIKQEVQEAAVSLEKATLKPEEKVEAEREIKESEDLEKEAKAAVDAVPEASEAKPAEISLEAAGVDGTVTIEAAQPAADRGSGTEDRIAVAAGEMDPAPVDGGEAEQTGTNPSEVSGLVHGDGSAAPVFQGDGETQLTDFSDQISGKENLDQETEVLVQEAPREVATSPAPQERTAPGSDTPAPAQDDMKEAPSSQQIQAAPETESISSDEPNANTAKVTGVVTPQGAGLPVDDDNDTSSLPADTEPGVGLDAVSGGLETQEVISTGEKVSESVPLDVNALVQSVLREAYLENTEDLQSYADKVKYFNECKKQVRDYVNQIREQAADITDNEELTIPITVTEESEDGSSSDVTQELNLTMEEAVRFLALGAEEDTSGDSDSGDDESDTPPPPPPPDTGTGVSSNLPGTGPASAEQEPVVEIPQEANSDQNESDPLANQDLQNMLQHQQQLINMFQDISELVGDVQDAVIRKADGGSENTETQEDEEVNSADTGENTAQLEMLDLQEGLQSQAQLMNLMANLTQLIADSPMAQIRDLEGGDASPDTIEGDLEITANPSDSVTVFETEFEDSTQKQDQYTNLLATVLRGVQEAEATVIRNLDGGDGDQGESSAPDSGSEGSLSVVERIFLEYNQEIAEIVQQAETALSDGESDQADNGKGSDAEDSSNFPDQENLENLLKNFMSSDASSAAYMTISTILRSQHGVLNAILKNMR